MAKHGDEGLGYEIVKAVNSGQIIEPITFNKVKEYCRKIGLNPSENHMKLILSNATENTHSPTYKKYFTRTARGKYMLLPKYKREIQYYWLNIDTEYYEWSFSKMEVGDSQTYSNLSEEGKKRRNQSCFLRIMVGDEVLAYETGTTKAITTICKVIDKREENDEIIVKFEKCRDYEIFLTWDEMKSTKSLSDCNIVGFHRGTLFDLDKKYFDIIVGLLETINIAPDCVLSEYNDNELDEINELVEETLPGVIKPTWNGRPEKQEFTNSPVTGMPKPKRKASVAANALAIAEYKCEYDGEKGTFLRKNGKQRYTEPHHLIPISRYADFAPNSLDVEENIVSLCSYCHNLLHYGRIEDKELIIRKLFNERKAALSKAGLEINKVEDLMEYYS